MMPTLEEVLRQAGRVLKESGVDNPALDAAVLLGHVTGHSRAGLYRDWKHILTPEEEARFWSFINRRTTGEPVAYLTGNKDFMGLEFAVDASVLIPRPETELLVEKALTYAGKGLLVEVGTGCGAIAVSLAVYLPRGLIYATDRSAAALRMARLNACRHGVGERVSFWHGDLLTPLVGLGLSGRVDLLAANLPYIATAELTSLPREVRLYEPRQALDGGRDGLELYRRLIPAAITLLKPGGRLLLEIGYEQRTAMSELLSPPRWETTFERDLAGWDRLVVARLVC